MHAVFRLQKLSLDENFRYQSFLASNKGKKFTYSKVPTVSTPATPAEFVMTKGSNTSWIVQEHDDNDCRMVLASNNQLSSQNQMTTEEEDWSGTSDTLTITEELNELNEMTNEGPRRSQWPRRLLWSQ